MFAQKMIDYAKTAFASRSNNEKTPPTVPARPEVLDYWLDDKRMPPDNQFERTETGPARNADWQWC